MSVTLSPVAASIPFDNEGLSLTGTNLQTVLDEVYSIITSNPEQIDSTTTGYNAVSNFVDSPVLRLTNPGLNSIVGIPAPPATSTRNNFILVNGTGATISISVNNNGVNGIIMGSSSDISIDNEGAIALVYSDTIQRWCVVGVIGLFVDTTSNQTIAGEKTYTANAIFTAADFQNKPNFFEGIRLFDNNTFLGVSFSQSALQTVDTDYILPIDHGGAGKVLSTNGTGVLSWITSTSGVSDHTLLTNIGTNTHAQIDTHLANTSNPHSVTKAQVGLSNADNTSDVNKPVSTATQTALNLKQTIISGDFPVFIQATEPSVPCFWIDTTGGNIQLWIKS